MVTVSQPEERYLEAGSTAGALYERARRVLPGGNTRTTVYSPPHPPYAARGHGATVVDADGQERLDFVNNYTALIHGHADSDINAAVFEQLQHGTAFGMPTAHEVALAELLVERIPGIEQARFTNSGSEAVMMAIKAARAYTGRPKIAKFEGCYHGSYDFAEVSMTTPPDRWGEPNPPSVAYSAGTPQAVLDNVIVMPYNDIAKTEQLIEEHAGQLAAVLIDPMPLRAGMVPGEPAFLQRLRELTREHGIVLIFDEVISLRTGYHGMQGIVGITPDLTTMGKIIGGGFPVGGVGGSAEVMRVFDPSQGYPRAPHGGTFNANPITMVAGRVAMEKLTPAAFERLDRLGAMLREGLAEALDGARVPGQVTGLGSLFHIHLHAEPIHGYRDTVTGPAERDLAARLQRGLMARGIWTAPGLVGCLSTPMDEPEVNTFIDAFATTLREVG